MSDLLHQNLATVQSDQQQQPVTMAAAATIAPTTFITFLTGTAQLENITPPVSGQHMLCLIFTNATPGAFLTTGNIQRAASPAQNIPVLMMYDPVSKKYWPGELA